MSAFVLATLAACGSCGDGRLACYPVSGSVTYRGQPAAGARMIFHPIGGSSELQCQRPVATVQEDGSFAVTTFFKSDGAPVGEYTVTIIWVHNRQLADGEDLRGGRASRNLLPNKYSSPETSDLRATVRKGTNVLTTFEL
ncbi:MAG: hypothetical protein R3E01_04625 [Pirellulaceae bacterium]